MAMLITHLAASTCSFTWMLIEWLHTRTPTIIGAVSGAITGLVIITPAAGYVDHTGAFVMGLVGAPLCYGGIMFKNWIGLDEKPRQSDYPDAFGVHSVGGIVGAILTVRHIFLLFLEFCKIVSDCFHRAGLLCPACHRW